MNLCRKPAAGAEIFEVFYLIFGGDPHPPPFLLSEIFNRMGGGDDFYQKLRKTPQKFRRLRRAFYTDLKLFAIVFTHSTVYFMVIV